MKRCKDCRREKPVGDFPKNFTNKGVIYRRPQCLECYAIAAKKRYKTDPVYREKMRAYSKMQHVKNNKK